jgi:hypothetical protein
LSGRDCDVRVGKGGGKEKRQAGRRIDGKLWWAQEEGGTNPPSVRTTSTIPSQNHRDMPNPTYPN